MQQQALPLGLGPVVNPAAIFWTCGDCLPLSGGTTSFIWQPPDHLTGKCVHCGQVVHFESVHGMAELEAELERSR